MTAARASPPRLFDADPPLPEGFLYQPDFISVAEEQALLRDIVALDFGEVRMHGVVAKRRVVHFGWSYRFEGRQVTRGREMPPYLLSIQARIGALTQVPPERFSEALVTDYPAGAAIGWHRDAPPFGIVVGVSLLSPCRFRFRRGAVGAWETASITLEPRSVYVLDGPARGEWQHHIPATESRRYSLTFRTLRRDDPVGAA